MSQTVHPIHYMFGSRLVFWESAERMAIFLVRYGGAVARNPCVSWAFLFISGSLPFFGLSYVFVVLLIW